MKKRGFEIGDKVVLEGILDLWIKDETNLLCNLPSFEVSSVEETEGEVSCLLKRKEEKDATLAVLSSELVELSAARRAIVLGRQGRLNPSLG